MTSSQSDTVFGWMENIPQLVIPQLHNLSNGNLPLLAKCTLSGMGCHWCSPCQSQKTLCLLVDVKCYDFNSYKCTKSYAHSYSLSTCMGTPLGATVVAAFKLKVVDGSTMERFTSSNNIQWLQKLLGSSREESDSGRGKISFPFGMKERLNWLMMKSD